VEDRVWWRHRGRSERRRDERRLNESIFRIDPIVKIRIATFLSSRKIQSNPCSSGGRRRGAREVREGRGRRTNQ
jgi:hypothetical protein